VFLVVVGIIIAIILLRFLGHLLSDGWSAASTAIPGGKIIVYVILGLTIFLLGPWLMDRGYRTIGKIAIWLVAGMVGLTFIAIMPSCNDQVNNSGDLPYYRR
jgi:predicted tellurium resistance membrane protein TerC